MEKPVNKETLFEYFAGRATPLQKKTIEGWLAHPENEDFYYQCLEAWERTYPQHLPDTEKAVAWYENFTIRTPFAEPEHETLPVSDQALPSRKNVFRWLAAASIVMVLMGGGLWILEDTIFYRIYTTRYGETRSLILPDNSQVTLNAHSMLKVPRGWFGEPTREAWVEGEAFFSISHTTDSQRFLVHTDNLTVEVLGTKFNVIDRRGKTQVVLQEGKIRVTDHQKPSEQPLLLLPGEQVVKSAKSVEIQKKTVKPESYPAWRENKLVFDHTPLPEVLQTVEDYYGIRIVLADSTLSQNRYTGILPNDDLNIILKSLSNIYGLQILREKNQIVLEPE
ncbi:MAG: FecR domain-containing protein [Cytophagales bacterium]|jgi:ferric-dicitrate binding protein FerR (iron transport regulator)|nr:FecR domain-containing protein [Cytophagales bacterium]